MVKIFLILLASIFTPLITPVRVHADTQNFVIQNFDVDYYLSRNNHQAGELLVNETIVAEFPAYNQNHGILRAIPQEYQGHSVNLQIQSVTNESGEAYSYTHYEEDKNLVLKIGNPNAYVHGFTTYKISYSMRNIINFPKDATGNELFWDINGTQWAQPIHSITGNVHIPSDLANSLTGQKKCYTGNYGSKDSNCSIKVDTENKQSIITITANNVTSQQNVSFVIGFNDQTFQQGPEVAAEQQKIKRSMIISALTLAALPITTFIVMYRKWRTEGRDSKSRGVIVPEYIAPSNLNVISSAYVINPSTAPKTLSAGIIEMAIKGYIKIHEIQTKKLVKTSTDYQLELIKTPTSLATEQQSLLNGLFDNKLEIGKTISLSSQSNKLHFVAPKIDNYLSEQLTATDYYKSNPAKAKSRYIWHIMFLFILGIILMALSPKLFFVATSLILSSVVVGVFSLIMPARTKQGTETRDYLLGLKQYIALAEKDRIAYLQSPKSVEKLNIEPNSSKQQIKLFEDLLPYAILFGIEKDWAKQFNNLYVQPPTWYDGNINTFNTAYLVSSLGKMNGAVNTAFTAPSSSGSSGFSGGGFSGGGGGGGGGGGW
ncbi:DUF2207 domain-containing protein [Candidatus Saccharibacteria bacterium]|nr:DUF2207 domain-containing protein [Candidatus Saccharibacteria bacterium]